MEHWIEIQVGDEQEGMQLIDRIIPPLTNQKVTLHAQQDIEITKAGGAVVKDHPGADKEFWIAGRAFTMDTADVYSVSPGDGDSGNFSNQLPHITLKKKTFPWEYETSGGEPWVALLTVTEAEQLQKDISIAELKENKEPGVFFPVLAQPEVYLEKDSDLCHVVDLEKEVFLNLVPQKGERSLLTHGKFVNLLEKADEMLEMDGYFSTVIGGRFIPSGEGETVKCTIHLVSMLGYDAPEELPRDCKKVRLVSLYHWDVFSKNEGKTGFVPLMEQIQCDMLRINAENELLAHGYVPKRHLFRSGENTVSLYRGPLIPFPSSDQSMDWKGHIPDTADGALIFCKETGLFDVSYSTAWQMGRLLTVQNKAVASAVVRWRKGTETTLRKLSAERFLGDIMEESKDPAKLAEKGVKGLLSGIGGEDRKL